MIRYSKLLLTFCLSISLFRPAIAQENPSTLPAGLQATFSSIFQSEPSKLSLAAIDYDQVRLEDQNSGMPRIAVPARLQAGLTDGGQWTSLPNGDQVWQIIVESSNGLGLMALYEEFFIPKGASLFMYSPDGKQVLGPYTYRDNPKNGHFMTGLIQGQTAVIEYRVPAAIKGQGAIQLFRVDQVYDPAALSPLQGTIAGGNSRGFGTSNNCHENINCDLGLTFQKEKRGIVRVIVVVEEGIGICSGNLLNNTRKDGTPYILTGFHCMDGFTPIYDMWRFDFNYETTGCDNPTAEPGAQALTGSVFRAGRQESDFLLLELTDTIPLDYNPYFLGWDSQSSEPDTSYCIHHPNADIKKIGVSYEPVDIINGSLNWNNGVTTPRNHHYEMIYSEGTFEVGSSGSALLDPEGLVIGQLNGGQVDENCAGTKGWFGRFNVSWEGGATMETSLKYWLNPDTLAQDTIHGMENPNALFVSGYVYTEEDFGVGNVLVGIGDGEELYLASTDSTGYYEFLPLPAGKEYTLVPAKTSNAVNGVSVLDIIQVRRHILGLADLDSPYKIIAADVDSNGLVTTLDIIHMQRLTLGLTEELPGVPSWQFIAEDFAFQDESMPLSEDYPIAYILAETANGKFELDFIGIKSGDVNLTADPLE
ncbi:MAG: hypothetical protein KTR30_06485 [Saprospiraceae bacterium]|nr:hypothetical protein [Saprospiraceae bacterium]